MNGSIVIPFWLYHTVVAIIIAQLLGKVKIVKETAHEGRLCTYWSFGFCIRISRYIVPAIALEEEQELNEKIRILKAQNDETQNDELRQKEISEVLDDHSCKINEYDDIIVRKLIDCVKVINKSEIKVIFKDGHEVNEEVKRK